MKSMCPQCGGIFPYVGSLIPIHVAEGESEPCIGSEQSPRNPLSDGRPLWSGEPNPHFTRPKTPHAKEPAVSESIEQRPMGFYERRAEALRLAVDHTVYDHDSGNTTMARRTEARRMTLETAKVFLNFIEGDTP